MPCSDSVTVSVLSIEGTDCRLDELGRLADRTGGKVRPALVTCFPAGFQTSSPSFISCTWSPQVVIANPSMLHSEFEQIIENRTIATHCSVSLLLPLSL